MDTRVHLFVAVFFMSCANYRLSEATIPEQVHLSLGDSLDSIVVMWSSSENLPYKVDYGTSPDEMVLQTESDVTHQPRQAGLAVPFVYRTVLKNLTRGMQYFYKIRSLVSSNKTLQFESKVFSFLTPAKSQEEPYRYLVYGDMGTDDNIPTYAMLETLADSGNYTAVLHVGDFAYDMESGWGKVGDKFFNRIQPFASRLPYMPSPGNHEMGDDFIHYRTRFSTPNTPWPIPLDKLWYSYNVGPVHFISYSTEVFFSYNQYYVCKQFDWLLQDLIQANKNRAQQPWIIAMGHRPMYCSNSNGDDCTNRFLRRWVKYGLEDLFYAQGVDLIIQAHEHSYERLWPVYDGKVYGNSYVNPRAPVHIISGAAGSVEGIDWMTQGHRNIWSAFKADRTSRFTFGQLEIHNATHLFFEQRDSSVNKVLDGFWLVQNDHRPFVPNITCEGKHRHPSCSCPPPILYVYIIVGSVASAILILVMILVVFVYYKKKSKRGRKAKVKQDRVGKFTQLHEENDDANFGIDDGAIFTACTGARNQSFSNENVPINSANQDHRRSRDTERRNSSGTNSDDSMIIL